MVYSARLLMPVLILFMASVVHAQDGPAPAPKEFVDLLEVDPRGGRVIRPAEFDLTKPGAKWQDWPRARINYEQTYSDYGSYRLDVNMPDPGPQAPFKSTGRPELRSINTFPVLPNRNYILSVLVKAEFDRLNTEVNVYMRSVHEKGAALTPRHTLGLPAITEGPDGWQRLEWPITTVTDPRVAGAKAALDLMARQGSKPVEVRIADYAFVELPAKPLEPLARGEGVTFPGSAGDLPMIVESHSVESDRIVVETTGARFVFDTANDTILASQRIEFPRELARWHSSLPLEGLRVDQQTDDVCVLTNDRLTIGVQRDSLLVISPQQELRMTLTNLLGGDFNRYSRSYLYSTDDYGGISVDPYIPAGTGLEPRSELLTEGLSFAELSSWHALQEQLAAGESGRPPWSTEELGSAEPGWQAAWTALPGTLFTTSVFPPRPFEWEKSFTEGRRTFRYHQDPIANPRKQRQVTNWLLWDFIPKMFGLSYTNYYEPLDDKHFREIVETAHGLGIGVIPYMSAYFGPTRDPYVYIDGVRQFKEKYDIDAVYSDGLPSADWMAGYKIMRMLRELFPSGFITVHNSTQQAGWDVSQHKPFMYTYATSFSMGEGVSSQSGAEWQYPRYVTTQFRKSNAFGKTLGNYWYAPDGEKMLGEASDLVTLVYNGRNNNQARRNYLDYVDQLYELWKEHGDQPFFYDRYYLPKAQELTGYKVGRTGMPIIQTRTQNGQTTIELKSLSPDAVIYYTTDGTKPDSNAQRYEGGLTVSAGAQVKAVAIAPELEPSTIAVVANE